jgi:phosphoribosylglycinamide formyltransferase 1
LLMSLLGIETVWIYILIYVIAITIIWPLMVIVVSFLFGQFRFFRGYLKRMVKRILGSKENTSAQMERLVDSGQHENKKIVNLAIFASGAGTNAQKIIDHFRHHPFIKAKLMVSNKSTAGALNIARKESIEELVIDKEKFFRGNGYVDELKAHQIDFIILAGFLWKLPSKLVHAWHRRIINVHPALLPKYGGKGLYGRHVHEAVIKQGETESGITIHYVDEIYDHGEHIFQEKVIIEPGDTPETLAKKIQALEHLHFPRIIEKTIQESVASRT